MNLDIPDAPRLRDTLAAGCLLLLVAVSGGVGYWIGSSRAPVAEDMTSAPAERQRDGSLILARIPDAKPKPPPHAIPHGDKEVRRVTTRLQPHSGTGCTCKPIDLTTSLVREGNGLRVIQSADGADITSGIDTPIVPLNLAPIRLWATGPSYDPFGKSWGGWIERDFGRLRAGADVYWDDGRPALRLRIGFTL